MLPRQQTLTASKEIQVAMYQEQPKDVSATRADSIHGNPTAASATMANSINFQEPVSIQW
jgi:hypothetical protein